MGAYKVGTLKSLRLLPEFRRDPIALMDRLRRDHGDLVELSIGPKKILFCFHPDHAERILKSQASRYRRSRLVFDKILPLTGRHGLVQVEGEAGREQRQLTGASLSMDAIRAVYPLLLRSTLAGIERIAAEGAEGREIDLASHMTDIVFKNALIFVFGEELADRSARLIAAFTEANALCGSKIRGLVSAPLFAPTPTNRRLRAAIARLDAEIHALIERRRSAPLPTRSDLLSILLAAGLPDDRIRDQLVTFLFAGHETTASSLTWTLYLLAKNAGEAERAHAECLAALGDREPALEDLRHLSHTLNTYQESLRLFPPSWTLARDAIEADEIDGHRVPKGSLVLIGLGQIQRHETFWKDPERFDPTRFESTEYPYSYIPFGGGSRICIGMRTALIEASLVLALILPRLRFHVRPGFVAEMDAQITAHPRAGLPITVERLAHEKEQSYAAGTAVPG